MAKEKKEILDQMLKSIFSGARVVVLTGAGISTASGISDFRGENGLYTSGIDAEKILSSTYFRKNPELFYQFYTQNMMIEGYEPNIIHQTLATLEKAGYIDGIITQNIDKLHQKAGSKNVVEIHGDGSKYYCTKCKKEYSGEGYSKNGYKCLEPGCSGMIRPGIVLYDEMLNKETREKAEELAFNADVFIILGSSLTVQTAQNLIGEYFAGLSSRGKGQSNELYIFTKGETPYDRIWWAQNKCEEDLKEVFEDINKAFRDLIISAIKILDQIYESNPQTSLHSKRLQMLNVLMKDFGFEKNFALNILSNYTFQVRNVDLKKELRKRNKNI